MTVINIALGFAVCYLPLDFLLPAESIPVSNNAASVDFLFKFMTVFGAAITVYVNGYVIYFACGVPCARRDDPPNAIGVPIHHAPKLEIWWTVAADAVAVRTDLLLDRRLEADPVPSGRGRAHDGGGGTPVQLGIPLSGAFRSGSTRPSTRCIFRRQAGEDPRLVRRRNPPVLGAGVPVKRSRPFPGW